MAAPLKWFPFYVDDWDTDEKVRALSFEERGTYLSLLCWQWREGAVPGDARKAAKIIHARVPAVRRVLELCFIDEGGEDGLVVNRKLAELRVNQAERIRTNSKNARSPRLGGDRYLYAALMIPIAGMSTEHGAPQVKIGWSRNPQARVTALAREMGQRVTLLGKRPAPITLEIQAHTDLAEHVLVREWFRDTPAVRQWLTANGVIRDTSGFPPENHIGPWPPIGRATVSSSERSRSRLRSENEKSLSAHADNTKATA